MVVLGLALELVREIDKVGKAERLRGAGTIRVDSTLVRVQARRAVLVVEGLRDIAPY